METTCPSIPRTSSVTLEALKQCWWLCMSVWICVYVYIYIYTHTYIRIQCCRFLKTCGIFTTPWFRSKEQFLFSEIWRRIFRNAAPVCHECALEFSQNIWFSSVIMPAKEGVHMHFQAGKNAWLLLINPFQISENVCMLSENGFPCVEHGASQIPSLYLSLSISIYI